MEEPDSTEDGKNIRTANKGKCAEKLRSYQQEGRQQISEQRRNPEIWRDKKGGTDYEENNF